MRLVFLNVRSIQCGFMCDRLHPQDVKPYFWQLEKNSGRAEPSLSVHGVSPSKTLFL